MKDPDPNQPEKQEPATSTQSEEPGKTDGESTDAGTDAKESDKKVVTVASFGFPEVSIQPPPPPPAPPAPPMPPGSTGQQAKDAQEKPSSKEGTPQQVNLFRSLNYITRYIFFSSLQLLYLQQVRPHRQQQQQRPHRPLRQKLLK